MLKPGRNQLLDNIALQMKGALPSRFTRWIKIIVAYPNQRSQPQFPRVVYPLKWMGGGEADGGAI